jgi:hypothetical protein
MKDFCILFTCVFLYVAISERVKAQSYPEHYTSKKTISIPIGLGVGKVSIEYLFLGKSARLPDAIAIDNSGEFIIGSRLQPQTIQKFDNDGRFVSVLATRGCDNGNVNYPSKLAVDSNNAIYVLDACRCIEPSFLTGGYSLKKFNSTGEFIYKVGHESVRLNPTEHDYISQLQVTPGGNVYFHDFYNSKNRKDAWGSPELEQGDFGVDASGSLVGAVTDCFYENYQGDVVKIEKKHTTQNTNYTITRYGGPEQTTKPKQFVADEAQLNVNKINTFGIDSAYESTFLGFDKSGDMYFDQSSVNQQNGMTQIIIPQNIVYKYSPQCELMTKIEFPKDIGGSRFVDSQGNVYLAHVVVATPKHFTEGDHIEIQKWVLLR